MTSHWPHLPALSRLLAPYVVAGASAVSRCHDALGCDRSQESRGGTGEPREVVPHASYRAPPASPTAHRDRTPTHPRPLRRAQFSSKQVGNDAFPPRARPAVRCGHAPCTTRVPFLDSLARAVSQERAAVCRARAHRHRRSPRCRSSFVCSPQPRAHPAADFLRSIESGDRVRRAHLQAHCVRLRVSVVGLLSVLIP